MIWGLSGLGFLINLQSYGQNQRPLCDDSFTGEMLLRCRRVASKDFVLDLLDDPENLPLETIPEIA
jgi:hypothetical protein